jgi:tRNA-dihydrouridine synthase
MDTFFRQTEKQKQAQAKKDRIDILMLIFNLIENNDTRTNKRLDDIEKHIDEYKKHKSMAKKFITKLKNLFK